MRLVALRAGILRCFRRVSPVPPGRGTFVDFPFHGTSGERGAWAERFAAGYLCGQGLSILARNYRCRFGEIDLIMRQDTTTVFVEVRFRRDSRFGTGLSSVDQRKKRRIIMSAHHYLQRNPTLRDRPCRFDIVSVSLPGEGEGIRWVPAAFDGYG